MKNIFAGLVLLILGGLIGVFTKEVVRFQMWSQRTIMGAQYIPSKRTYRVMRIVGILLIIIGLIVLVLPVA